MKPSRFFHGFAEWWRCFRPFLLLLALPLAAPGQSDYATPYTIATLAGQAGTGGDVNGTNSTARFKDPNGLAVDGAGNIYVADTDNEVIRKITPAGMVTTLAAKFEEYEDDRFESPVGLAVDNPTNLYVVDGNTIAKMTLVGTNWVVTTVAGGEVGTNDGAGEAAQFGFPNGIAVDSATNLYVADTDNDTIRKLTWGVVTTNGVRGGGTVVVTNWGVTTLAGLPEVAGTNDGTGSAARFFNPTGVAVDGASNLYVVDSWNYTIRKVTPVGSNWTVTTLAGKADYAGTNDGMGSAAQFFYPIGVAIDSITNLFVTDRDNNTIRKITPSGMNWVVTTLAGLARVSGTNDGTGNAARFSGPSGVAVDSTGNLYVADYSNYTMSPYGPPMASYTNNIIRRGFLAGGAPVILTNGTGLTFSNGEFGFNLAAATGQSVVVDASTNSETWLSIWTNTVGVGVLPFSDPQSGAYSNRIYRAHLP